MVTDGVQRTNSERLMGAYDYAQRDQPLKAHHLAAIKGAADTIESLQAEVERLRQKEAALLEWATAWPRDPRTGADLNPPAYVEAQHQIYTLLGATSEEIQRGSA